jgi:hypothetical protein
MTKKPIGELAFETVWHGPGQPPPDVVALRRAVYVEETGLLAEKDLVDRDDLVGRHLCVYSTESGRRELVAAMQVLDAESGSFGHHSGLSRDILTAGYCGSRAVIAKPFRARGLFSLLLYTAMRDYRMQGRRFMFGYMEPGEPPAYKILRYHRMENVAPRSVQNRAGKAYQVVAVWQDLAYGLHRAFETMPEELKTYVQNRGLLAEEIETTVQARIQRFYENPWFERLREGSLAREHYIPVLANMHQFVRWTTRLLGKVVGISSESPLRRHFIEHLEGEVDHEVLIEHDLQNLGADVEYVKKFMAPYVEMQEFMMTQESMATFHQDPVLFLAVPFSVEGLSAHLPKGVLQQLMAAITSWGIDNPRQVLSFLASHVHTDGGTDGHWEMSRQMIRRYVTSEAQLQRFLNIIHLVMNSHERAYTAYAAIPAFSATVNSRNEQETQVSAA